MTIDRAAVLERFPPEVRSLHGIPNPDEVARRERAAEVATRVLADHLRTHGLRASALGPGWSRDLDAHVHSWPREAALADAGWVCLDRLLARLGSPGRGRWMIVEGSTALAAVDLHETVPPDPVEAVLARCRRRREVRVREALELSALRRAGHDLPPDELAVRAAAEIEAWLGGDRLSDLCDGVPRPGPIELPTHPARRWVRMARAPFRRRLTVAISGVDGAGKSTAGRALRELLARGGVPVAAVWARPGLHLDFLVGWRRSIKRLLGQSPQPGVRAAARGEAARLPSRRGVIGWTWSLFVTLAFLFDVYRQHAQARGVVVYDRHVVDAIATLDVLYAGPNLRLQRSLVRWLMPRAALTAYLAIDAATAAERKPGDTVGLRAVAAQLATYEAEIERVAPLLRLDATASVDENARAVLDRLLELS